MKKSGLFLKAGLSVIFAVLMLASCSSVFSGGTGGRVVDAESTANPKDGIPDVEVYVYINEKDRDSDFSLWKSNERFSPKASYYARTTTSSDGSFTLSKIMWKEGKPVFGKDGDVSQVYLLFYHEDFGLEKGSTIILSDSTGDSVYQEMTRFRKTTVLVVNVDDAATGSAATEAVQVIVTVPQTTSTVKDAEPVTKEAVITGNGSITLTYPRWQSEEDRKNKKETEPEISIEYKMAGDEINFKACYNGDGEAGSEYAFLSTPVVKKTVSGSSYPVHLYGKKTKLQVPVVGGTYGTNTVADDGIIVSMKASLDGGTTYTLDCGETTTYAQGVGTSGTLTHGNFSGLGQNVYWRDETYTGKYAELKVEISADGTSVQKSLRSDTDSYNFQL